MKKLALILLVGFFTISGFSLTNTSSKNLYSIKKMDKCHSAAAEASIAAKNVGASQKEVREIFYHVLSRCPLQI